MAITRERFEQGLTYDAYKAQMTRNQDRFVANEQTVELSADDLDYFRGLAQPVNVLVLAEDWCGDVINNLPVLGRLAAESGRLNLRVFLRDQNLDIMDQYLNGEFRSIPVFAFFDADFRELGRWIERPAQVKALMAQRRRELFASDPAFAGVPLDTPPPQLPEQARLRLTQFFGDFRKETRAFSDREVVREIRALLEPALARTSQPEQRAVDESVEAAPLGRQPVKVRITYCAECGYEPQALALTSALMYEFLNDLSSIELIPWHEGSFDVMVGDDVVHSMYRDGGFPEPPTIIHAVRARL